MAGFETVGVAACPPVVEYSREFQARVAAQLALLPEGSVDVEMMGYYAVMREQVSLMKFRTMSILRRATVQEPSPYCVAPRFV